MSKPKKPKQSAADKAFIESDRHSLDDLNLQPWTPDRMIRGQELGMVFPNIGKQGWDQYRKTSVYPGATRDVILFVFLSTLEPEDVDDATWRDAKVFGVKRNLHNPDRKEFWEAYAMFMKVQNEIQASVALPKGAETGEEGEDESGND